MIWDLLEDCWGFILLFILIVIPVSWLIYNDHKESQEKHRSCDVWKNEAQPTPLIVGEVVLFKADSANFVVTKLLPNQKIEIIRVTDRPAVHGGVFSGAAPATLSQELKLEVPYQTVVRPEVHKEDIYWCKVSIPIAPHN